MNTDTDFKLVNLRDFIWIDPEAKSFRVRVRDGRDWLLGFRDRAWHWLRPLDPGELLEMAKRAVPHTLCLECEYNVPFHPMPQQQMFEAMGPYYNDCIITSKRGQLGESLHLKASVRFGKPVRALSYFWGNLTTRSLYYAGTFFLN